MCKSAYVILLLSVVILLSCNNITDSSEHIIKAVPDKPDTAKAVIITNFTGKAYPLIFQAAFDSSTRSKEEDISFNFSRWDIGKIKIETGKIIAGDPVVIRTSSPFIKIFPIGEFPVQLALAISDNDERVAFSRIVFSDSAISKWEFALKKGQTPIPLGDSNF